MAFNGYFIKVGTEILPNYIIAKKGYKSTPNQRTDLDSYTDGDGKLHRNILPVKRSKVWLTTKSGLRYSEKLIIQSFFSNRDVVTMQYFNEETNNYATATFYVPDITFVIDYLDKNKKPVYEALELTFIAYGGDL